MRKYKALMRRYREQPSRDIFAHFYFNGPAGETWEAPYARLVEMAKPEPWDFENTKFKKPGQSYPILTNYLNYTFLRLQDQGRIAYSDDGDRACFNTGLQTTKEADIFATFFRNQEAEARDQPDWNFYTWADSYSTKVDDFRKPELPEIASYIDDPRDLVFDLDCNIEVNYEHLIEQNRERLPEVLRQNDTLARAAIEGAVSSLKRRVARNYKTAIPHWYDDHVQLLLPLNLTSDTEADLALVADRDRETNTYRFRTALDMAMAYIDARLITRPDREWLNP